MNRVPYQRLQCMQHNTLGKVTKHEASLDRCGHRHVVILKTWPAVVGMCLITFIHLLMMTTPYVAAFLFATTVHRCAAWMSPSVGVPDHARNTIDLASCHALSLVPATTTATHDPKNTSTLQCLVDMPCTCLPASVHVASLASSPFVWLPPSRTLAGVDCYVLLANRDVC
jgi:hypothetical protein